MIITQQHQKPSLIPLGKSGNENKQRKKWNKKSPAKVL